MISQPLVLSQLAILINTDFKAQFPIELKGFANAATARGARFTPNGFIFQC